MSVGQTGRVACTLTVRRAYANLAYNASTQASSGEVPTLDRKLDSIEERIQARRDALGRTATTFSSDEAKSTDSAHVGAASDASSEPQPTKKGIMSILPGITHNIGLWRKKNDCKLATRTS